MSGCGHEDVAGAERKGSALRRVLWIVFAVNATMFGAEIATGLLARSVALHADALDFFGDASAYLLTLFVLDRSIRWKAGAALAKAVTMLIFGCIVLGEGVHHALTPIIPDARAMGLVGLIALAANLGCAALLFSYRGRDVNLRSVWLCSRNDALANIAVVFAGVGVFGTATRWPDLTVAAGIAGLSFWAASSILRQALRELAYAKTPPPKAGSSSSGLTGNSGTA